MANTKCPCEECILLAICRYKSYRLLVNGCSLLSSLLYKGSPIDLLRYEDFMQIIQNVEKILEPIEWYTYKHKTDETKISVRPTKYKHRKDNLSW